MDTHTLFEAFLVGLVALTMTSVSCLALIGLVLAIYVAVPSARLWLEDRLFSDKERARIRTMERIDCTYRRQLKELWRNTRPVVYVEK